MMRTGLTCLLLTSCAWVTEEELDLYEEDCACEGGGLVYYPDNDGDGWGDETRSTTCPEDEGYITDGGDCDDSDNNIHPGAEEHCDEVDDDCDGTVDEDDAVDAPTWYQDADGDGWADESIWLTACEAPNGYVDGEQIGDCDDTREDVSPDRSEVCGDLLDNDCDGDASICPLTGSVGWGTERTVVMSASEDTADRAGAALAGGADLTGDGTPDLLVGVPDLPEPPYGGAALVFPGPFEEGEELTIGDAAAVLQGTSEGLQAGAAVAVLGDIDGGGDAWVAVTAAPSDPEAAYVGQLYLLRTPVGDWLDVGASADLVLEGSSPGDYFGFAIAAGLDVVGDSYPDLLVGAPGDSDATGLAYLFQTPISEFGGTGQAVSTITGGGAGDALGYSVALLMDVDGDGQDDLLLGAPTAEGTGQAGLFLSPVDADISLPDADRTYSGNETGDFMGEVASAGDVDGDGYGDLLVGAPNADHGSGFQGTVWLIQGANSPASSILGAEATIQGAYSGERLGYALAGIGDFDADGHDDLLLGAPGRDWPESDAGVAYLFYGALSGELTTYDADATLEGPGLDGSCGTALASPGDMNGDGFTDLLLGAPNGAPGRAALVLGWGW